MPGRSHTLSGQGHALPARAPPRPRTGITGPLLERSVLPRVVGARLGNLCA